MRGSAVVALVMMAIAAVPATAAVQEGGVVGPKSVRCAHVTAKEFRAWSGRVWHPKRWDRDRRGVRSGMPRRKTLGAQRVKLRCAAGPGHRRSMRKTWRRDKKSFFRHRKGKIEDRRRQQRIEALTPYDCGSAGSFAIPCSIVKCESGYDWDAVNPSSGAAGAYQFLPSSYAAWCTTCDWSREDQHRAAGDYYRAAGGAPWVCAG